MEDNKIIIDYLEKVLGDKMQFSEDPGFTYNLDDMKVLNKPYYHQTIISAKGIELRPKRGKFYQMETHKFSGVKELIKYLQDYDKIVFLKNDHYNIVHTSSTISGELFYFARFSGIKKSDLNDEYTTDDLFALLPRKISAFNNNKVVDYKLDIFVGSESIMVRYIDDNLNYLGSTWQSENNLHQVLLKTYVWLKQLSFLKEKNNESR